MSDPHPSARISRTLAAPVVHRLASALPANDDEFDPQRQALLRAALRLFAVHGVSAAQHAHSEAERAFFAAERSAYRWWLEVTRTLDRKLASETSIHTRREPASGSGGLPRR